MTSKVSVIVVTHPEYRKYREILNRSLKTLAPHELVEIENHDKTLSAAVNQGIEQSTGNLIVRVDADDWIDPQLVTIERDYLDAHPDIDCVWCDYWTTRERGQGIFSIEYLDNSELEHACGAMYRRHVWETLKYDESLKFQESFDFWQRFKLAGFKAHHIAQALYFYRRGHNSMSTSPERDKVRAELERKYLCG